ncbi:hypothetical protein C028_02340 [Brucella abortus 63/168]|nr:hypothetical protein C028_02340 [Brucella abortus 63/168]
MFGHIGCRAAIFAAERQPLQHAQRNQDDRCEDAERGGAGQKADQEGRSAHDDDGNKECIFTADEVADASEDESAEGAHKETCRKSQKNEDVSGCFRVFVEEGRADKGRQRSIEIEVIPFKDGTERGRKDDLALFARHFLCAGRGA